MLLKRVNILYAQDKKRKENFHSGVPYLITAPLLIITNSGKNTALAGRICHIKLHFTGMFTNPNIHVCFCGC